MERSIDTLIWKFIYSEVACNFPPKFAMTALEVIFPVCKSTLRFTWFTREIK